MFEYNIHRAQKSRYMCLYWNLATWHLFALSSNLLLLLLFCYMMLLHVNWWHVQQRF